jgi:hypothetical protein
MHEEKIINELIEIAYKSIQRTKGAEYAPNVHEIQLCINQYVANKLSQKLEEAVKPVKPVPEKKRTFFEELEDYFKNTPKEQIQKDWDKLAEFDKIAPTVSEFIRAFKQETLEEVIKPIGDFIIANATATEGQDGAYYHYSEVCNLLKLQAKKMYSEEEVGEILLENMESITAL